MSTKENLPISISKLLTAWLILCLTLPTHAQSSLETLEESPPVRAWSLANYLQQELGVKFDGSSPYLVVQLESGDRAVFRSESGEVWGSQAEVAGYRMSQYLGLNDLVPLTVVRRLSASDFPAGQWPYSQASRLGSLQEFLPARPVKQSELDRANPDRVASLELLTFLMGRFDNHSGNTLVDKSGRFFIVDFENCLQFQKVRFGETPFVRYGKGRWDLPSPGKDESFGFDDARILFKPSLEELKTLLSPYRAAWSGSLEVLHRRIHNSRDQRLRTAVWDHRLWVQVKVRSRHPAYTKRFATDLMRRLESLTVEGLEKDILLPPFTTAHALAILERRDQILKAYREQREG